MEKTLYISDLDGTLLNKNAELSEYTKSSLNRMIASGMQLSVATARTAATALRILDGVNWNTSLVLLNGVLIYDMKHTQYERIHYLDAGTVTEILTILKRLETTGLMYQFVDNAQATYYEPTVNEPVRSFIEERKTRYNKVFLQTDTLFAVPPDKTIYFTLLDTYDEIKPVYDALTDVPGSSSIMYKDNYSADLWYLEVFSPKASKKYAVSYLRETYGFDRIVGFGDNLNDLPMFAACDIRVAVENAEPEVKAAADYVCGTNENDGVVKWLEEHRGTVLLC